MRCYKAQEFLSQELDGVLPPRAAVELEKHLDDCSGCQSYREDIQLGHRLLAATEPELPDNFEWKLQLKLNQTLKESAGEVAYPWHENRLDRWSWFRNFGSAAAFGLAAVLALAIFLQPAAPPGEGLQPVDTVAGVSDRLPLEPTFDLGTGRGRAVSVGSPFQPQIVSGQVQGWSGQNLEDLRTIHRLRADNQNLRRMLIHSNRQLQLIRAQLDSTEKNALDLHEGEH